jgi:hypothetical protein
MLQIPVQDRDIGGIRLGNAGPSIHSLLFADDLIISRQETEEEALTIKSALDLFCQLQANYQT